MTTATKGKPFGVMAEEDWKTTQDNLVQFAGLPKAHPLDKLFTNAYQPA